MDKNWILASKQEMFDVYVRKNSEKLVEYRYIDKNGNIILRDNVTMTKLTMYSDILRAIELVEKERSKK